MAKQVWAVYEGQVLRLLEPLDLPDGQRVRIQVIASESADQQHALCEEKEGYLAVAAQEAVDNHAAPDSAPQAEGSIKALLEQLVREGRLRPHPLGPTPPDPVSQQERLELDDLLGQAPGKPLSEIVLDERGER
jgi:predicted DNA-binding antitoxin AbrB/MazE fold protein